MCRKTFFEKLRNIVTGEKVKEKCVNTGRRQKWGPELPKFQIVVEYGCCPASEGREHVGGRLHDLVLRQTTVDVGIHGISGAGRDVLDEAEAEGPSAILVVLELGDGRFGSVGRVESDNAGTAGSTTRLILDFGLLNLAYGREELDQIVVACRPRKLEASQYDNKGDRWLGDAGELTLRT